MEERKNVIMKTMTTKNGNGIQLLAFEDDIVVTQKWGSGDLAQDVKAILDLKHKQGDALICSYPKSGTNWLAHMTNKLLKADNYMPLIFIDESIDNITSRTPPRVILTHLRPKRLPTDHVNIGGKINLLLRNPKDVSVSFYYHLKDSPTVSNTQTWDEFLASFLEGSTPLGSLFDYLGAWNKEILHRERGLDIEVFFYEDFIVDCPGQLKRLAHFLGLLKSIEELTCIAEDCSMENLRALTRFNARKEHSQQDGKSIIYRKGMVGDWKNHFTVAQNEQFDAMLEASSVARAFNFKYTI